MQEDKIRRPSFGNTIKTRNDICFYCKRTIDDFSRTIDHLIPKCLGGIRSNDNKVYSCKSCNQLKADFTPEQFVKVVESLIKYEEKESNRSIGNLKKIKRSTELMIKNKKHKR